MFQAMFESKYDLSQYILVIIGNTPLFIKDMILTNKIYLTPVVESTYLQHRQLWLA